MDMTAKLFECDRDEMYSYVLRLCSKSLSLLSLFVLLFYYFSVCNIPLTPNLLCSHDLSPVGVLLNVQCSWPRLSVAVCGCVRERDGEWDQSEVRAEDMV